MVGVDLALTLRRLPTNTSTMSEISLEIELWYRDCLCSYTNASSPQVLMSVKVCGLRSISGNQVDEAQRRTRDQ